MKKFFNIVNNAVTFTFDGLPDVDLVLSTMSAENQRRAAIHGMLARIGDMAAGDKTEAARRHTVEEAVKYYRNSVNTDWNMKPSGVVFNPVIAKIAEKRGCTYPEAQVWLNEKILAELEGLE